MVLRTCARDRLSPRKWRAYPASTTRIGNAADSTGYGDAAYTYRIKAAYDDAVATSYFDYPASSVTQTTCATTGGTANTANCNNVFGDLTDVGRDSS